MKTREELQKELEEITMKIDEAVKDASKYSKEEVAGFEKRSQEIIQSLDEMDAEEKRKNDLETLRKANEERLNRAANPVPYTVQGDQGVPQTPVIRSAETKEQREALMRDAFNKWVITGNRADLYAYETEQRLLGTGTGMQGGSSVVPVTMYDSIIELMDDVSALRKVCTIQNGVTDGMRIPVEKKNTDGQITAEGVAITATNDDIFGEETLDLKNFTIGLPISRKQMVETKNGYDLYGVITRIMGKRLGVLEEAEHMKEVRTGTTIEVESATTGKIGVDDLVDTQFSVLPSYHGTASWLASPLAVSAIRKLKDNTTRPLYDPALRQAEQSMLLGASIYMSAGMDDVAAGKHPIIFGDFSYAILGISWDLTIEIEKNYATQGSTFWVSLNTGLVISNTEAFAKLKIKS